MTPVAHPSARTAAAIAARQRNVDAMLRRVAEAIRRLQRKRRPVSVAAIARQADVSRTFLYENAAARQQVSDAVERNGGRRVDGEPPQGDDQSWRERARNAEDALKASRVEIRQQRSTIADLLGRIRDLEDDDARHTVGRLSADNIVLRQCVGDLTVQNRTLEERLQAARSNARFLDRRVADLEAAVVQARDHAGQGQTN